MTETEHVCDGTNGYDIACVDGRLIMGTDPWDGDCQSWPAAPCKCLCHNEWWNAYLRGDYQAIPDDVLVRLDAAEKLMDRLFGISAAYYVRAGEAPGKSAKLADIIAAAVLSNVPAEAGQVPS